MRGLNQRFLKVVFAAGGTGGHLYPAIAVADALRDRGASITFVGTPDRLEATIVPKAGYPLTTIAGRPLARKASWEFLRTLADNATGTVQSLSLLARLQPDVVIATGGYVCFPAVLAARILRALRLSRAPIALLEPNAKPGLTNRMLAPLVDEVWGAFADADSRFTGKYVRTGVPVRARLRALPARDAAVASLGLQRDRKTLLVMGGSQGARTINDAMRDVLNGAALPQNWQAVVVTGERDFERIRGEISAPNAIVRSYLEDPSEGYAAADLVIARAGASTLAELAAAGKPAILVPYPFAADDHQASNAERFAGAGAGVVIADDDVRRNGLGRAIADATAPRRIDELQGAAERLRAGDPVATILARVDWLTARNNAPVEHAR